MTAPAAERRAYSVSEAATALNVSRDLVNSMIAAGRLRSVKLGTRRLIPVAAIEDLLAEGDNGVRPTRERA